MEARSVEQTAVFEAAEQFARVEGILSAPESNHAKFHDGVMTDYIPTDDDLKVGFDGIPRFPGNME